MCVCEREIEQGGRVRDTYCCCDCTGQFSSQCDISKVAKMVHKNLSDTWLAVLANRLLPSLSRTCARTHTHTHTHTHVCVCMCTYTQVPYTCPLWQECRALKDSIFLVFEAWSWLTCFAYCGMHGESWSQKPEVKHG